MKFLILVTMIFIVFSAAEGQLDNGCQYEPGKLTSDYTVIEHREISSKDACASICIALQPAVDGVQYNLRGGTCVCVVNARLGGAAAGIISCLLAAPTQCPADKPYAYSEGLYCCKFPREKIYAPQGRLCDGGPLSIHSRCCEGDEHRSCPSNGVCVNHETPSDYECQLEPGELEFDSSVDFLSIKSKATCVAICIGKKKQEPEIDAVQHNYYYNICSCVKNVKGKKSSSTQYKSCRLVSV